MLAAADDHQSVELLLRVMETPAAKVQGSALRLAGSQATDTLLAAEFLVENGVTPVIAAMDAYEDEPIEAQWSVERNAHGYHDSVGRWITVDHPEIACYTVDWQRVVAEILVQFDRAGSKSPQTLIDGCLWDVGVIRLTGAKGPVPVWFSRRLSDADVWKDVTSLLERRPPAEVRVILTSTRGERIPPSPSKRNAIIAVSDVMSERGKLAISPQVLGARVFPEQVQYRYPIDHSEDHGVVWLRGKSIRFSGDRQREALKQLFNAYWSASPVLRTATVLEEAGYGDKVNSFAKAFGERDDWRQFIKYAEGDCWIEP